jgi:hypothetical protein
MPGLRDKCLLAPHHTLQRKDPDQDNSGVIAIPIYGMQGRLPSTKESLSTFVMVRVCRQFWGEGGSKARARAVGSQASMATINN